MNPNTPLQTRVTDFFKNSHSRSIPTVGKNAVPWSSTSQKLLSLEAPIRMSIADKQNENSDEESKTPITPNKRRLSSGSAVSGSKRAKAASSKKTATTKTSAKSATRSVNMISFGPRVGKLDFDSAIIKTDSVTSATRIVSSCNEEVELITTASATTTVTVQESQQQSSTPTKINVQEIKERLKGCKNLANLKQHLASINGCAEKVKEFKSMKVSVLSPVKSAFAKMSPRKISSPEKFSLSGLTMIPSPLRARPTPSTPSKLRSSPYLANCVDSPRSKATLACSRKLFEDDTADVAADSNDNTSNAASSQNQIPAYKRFAYLSKTCHSSDAPQLPIPAQLKKIGDLFRRIDYFAWHYKKRQEICTFDKLKENIELATRRNFDLPMLVKVLTVLNREDKMWFQLSQEIIGGRFQLTISPHFEDHVRSIHSVNMLLEREREFNKMLLEITKREHLKFLATMKLTLTPGKTVFNWHPMFSLDSVEDVVPDMSLIPERQVKKQKLMHNPSSILHYFTPRESVKEEFKVESKNEAKKEEAIPTAKVEVTKVQSGFLKGIPVHLLNKVREKEAATKARLMFRSPEIDRELAILARAPAIIRIIERYFASTKAKSHTFEQVIKKVAESLKSTMLLAEKQINYLLSLELRSDPTDIDKRWLKKTTLSHVTYMIIEQECRMAFLQEQIKTRIEHLNNSS